MSAAATSTVFEGDPERLGDYLRVDGALPLPDVGARDTNAGAVGSQLNGGLRLQLDLAAARDPAPWKNNDSPDALVGAPLHARRFRAKSLRFTASRRTSRAAASRPQGLARRRHVTGPQGVERPQTQPGPCPGSRQSAPCARPPGEQRLRRATSPRVSCLSRRAVRSRQRTTHPPAMTDAPHAGSGRGRASNRQMTRETLWFHGAGEGI